MLRERLKRTDRSKPPWELVAAGATVLLLVVAIWAAFFDIGVTPRSVGVLESIALKFGAVVVGAGLLTQLGDPWFLLLVATIVYLAGVDRSYVRDPRDGAFVLGVTFAAFSFSDLLKHLYLAPRPEGAGSVTLPAWIPTAIEAFIRNITTGTGYAFPSGHALGTAAVFAALAYKLDVGPARTRGVAAAVGVLLVAATRLLLGVHFLVDVTVGALAGVTLFVVAATIGRREPLRVFGLGVVIGVLALIATAGAPEPELWKVGQWLGASLGAGIAWRTVNPSTYLNPRQTVAVGVPLMALWLAIYVIAPPLVVTVVGTALVAGATIVAPAVVDRLDGTAGGV